MPEQSKCDPALHDGKHVLATWYVAAATIADHTAPTTLYFADLNGASFAACDEHLAHAIRFVMTPPEGWGVVPAKKVLVRVENTQPEGE